MLLLIMDQVVVMMHSTDDPGAPIVPRNKKNGMRVYFHPSKSFLPFSGSSMSRMR